MSYLSPFKVVNNIMHHWGLWNVGIFLKLIRKPFSIKYILGTSLGIHYESVVYIVVSFILIVYGLW